MDTHVALFVFWPHSNEAFRGLHTLIVSPKQCSKDMYVAVEILNMGMVED